MAKKNNNHILLIGLVVLAIGVVVYALYAKKCKLQCEEGFKMPPLGENFHGGLTTSPVDYVFKSEDGWTRDPRWQANPSSYRQPLTHGPVDLEPAGRRLAEGRVFESMLPGWQGAGADVRHVTNGDRTRTHLTSFGEYGLAMRLHNAPHPRFGRSDRPSLVEADFNQRSPFQRIYGGDKWLGKGQLN